MTDEPFWTQYDTVIVSNAGPRPTYEVFIRGRQVATRDRLDDAKTFVEKEYGPLQWSRKRLDKMEVTHRFFGPTTEFGEAATIHSAELPALGRSASATDILPGAGLACTSGSSLDGGDVGGGERMTPSAVSASQGDLLATGTLRPRGADHLQGTGRRIPLDPQVGEYSKKESMDFRLLADLDDGDVLLAGRVGRANVDVPTEGGLDLLHGTDVLGSLYDDDPSHGIPRPGSKDHGAFTIEESGYPAHEALVHPGEGSTFTEQDLPRMRGVAVRVPNNSHTASDYEMDHRPLEDAAPMHDLSATFPDDVYDHPEYYSFGEWTAEAGRVLRQAKGKPDAQVAIYRALPAGETRINTGDWVTTVRSYAALHLQKMERGRQWHIVSATVPARTLRTGGNDIIEWGYWGSPVGARVASLDNPRPVLAGADLSDRAGREGGKTASSIPPVLYHGTRSQANVDPILSQGIRPSGGWNYLTRDLGQVVEAIGSGNLPIFAIRTSGLDLERSPFALDDTTYRMAGTVPPSAIIGVRWATNNYREVQDWLKVTYTVHTRRPGQPERSYVIDHRANPYWYTDIEGAIDGTIKGKTGAAERSYEEEIEHFLVEAKASGKADFGSTDEVKRFLEPIVGSYGVRIQVSHKNPDGTLGLGAKAWVYKDGGQWVLNLRPEYATREAALHEAAHIVDVETNGWPEGGVSRMIDMKQSWAHGPRFQEVLQGLQRFGSLRTRGKAITAVQDSPFSEHSFRSPSARVVREVPMSTTAGFGDDPETQRRLEELAEILTTPTGRPYDPIGDLPDPHAGYGGYISQDRSGRLTLEGRPITKLYRVVDPGEWELAQQRGYLQSHNGYTRASAKADERWRNQGAAGVRGYTLEIDYDPSDDWHASAEGYAATRTRIPLSRVRKVGSRMASTGGPERINARDWNRGDRVVVARYPDEEGTVVKIQGQGIPYSKVFLSISFDSDPDRPAQYDAKECRRIPPKTAARTRGKATPNENP